MKELSRIIADEIRQKGPISLARFMDLALHCPVYGYYERDADRVGRRGDFYTSVSIGPAFGDLLAARLAAWLEPLLKGDADRLQVVEAGAHDGQLARDILGWLRRRHPALLKRIDYILLEPSRTRRAWQRETLKAFADTLRWASDLKELGSGPRPVQGVILSNEFLDALPLHRFAWDRGTSAWSEWLVAVQEGRFVWTQSALTNRALCTALHHMVPEPIRQVLPDGYVLEYSPAARQWWQDAAQCLERGYLMTFDYGFDGSDRFRPERTGGTLRAYQHHRVTTDVLAQPGELDITAHVGFEELRLAGEANGLHTECFERQETFLVRLLSETPPFERPDPGWIRQFKTLIHPDHFGRSFLVLVQSKGLGSDDFDGAGGL